MFSLWQTWGIRAALILFFTASLVFVLFLANGLQYDFFSNQIRRTGIIDITYADPQANVFLDGEKLSGRLPFVASNVLPGEYSLVIGREGFWDYQLEVEVREDLITRVKSIFLYPLDVLSKTKLIFDFDDEEAKNVWLNGGYLLLREKNALFYAKLEEGMSEDTFKEAKILAIPIRTVTVSKEHILIEYDDGRRQIINILDSGVEDVPLSQNYVLAGNKWVYFKDNLLSIFDGDLKRVIYANNLKEEDGRIISVRCLYTDGREFLSVKTDKDSYAGFLYEIKGERLIQIDESSVKMVMVTAGGNYLYIKNDREIWLFDGATRQKSMLARLKSSPELVSANVDIFKSNDLFFLKNEGEFLIMDHNLENVRSLFPGLEVMQVQLVDKNKLFFLNKYLPDDSPNTKTRLLMLDLESN